MLYVTTSTRIELARAKHNRFQVCPLNRSGTMSLYITKQLLLYVFLIKIYLYINGKKTKKRKDTNGM